MTAFLVADIARRGADQPRHGMFFHELRHIEADHRLFVVEQKFGERAAKFGFTDAGWTEKNKRADRPVLILQAGAGAAHGIGHGVNRARLGR